LYRLAKDDATLEAREMTALLLRLLADARQTREDAARLKQILKLDPEKLCKKQNRC
jgi:hypothetical protein